MFTSYFQMPHLALVLFWNVGEMQKDGWSVQLVFYDNGMFYWLIYFGLNRLCISYEVWVKTKLNELIFTGILCTCGQAGFRWFWNLVWNHQLIQLSDWWFWKDRELGEALKCINNDSRTKCVGLQFFLAIVFFIKSSTWQREELIIYSCKSLAIAV